MWFDVDAAIAEAPVNILPLVLTSDFLTIKADLAYNAAGIALQWNFLTTAGAYTQTSVTPTTGGNYDWAAQGNGMYSIEIPASGGASINNDTEGFGWFTGSATGVLPWRGPIIGFRAAGTNDELIDTAYTSTGLGQLAATTPFGKSLRSIIAGTVDDSAFTPTTTEFESNDVVDAAADVWTKNAGRFTINTTTSALRGVQFLITDYSKVASNGHFTVSRMDGGALPAAPVDGDLFISI